MKLTGFSAKYTFLILPLWILFTLWGAYCLGITTFCLAEMPILQGICLAIQTALLILAPPFFSHRRGYLCGYIGLLLIINTLFLCLVQPSNERDWARSCARNPVAIFEEGGLVQIKNIRDFQYVTEFDFVDNYIDDSFDLAKIAEMDIILVYWMGEAIAHSMVTFRFTDGKAICFSMEVRKLASQTDYNMLSGLFRQNEILCIAGSERDLIGLRTNFRHEQLYLYPVNGTPEEFRRHFISIIDKLNKLNFSPEFYNTLTYNCTSSLIPALNGGEGAKRDFRLLLNGFSDQLAYENGYLTVDYAGQSFSDLKIQRYTNSRVDLLDIYADGFDFSQAIRTDNLYNKVN